MKDNRISKGDLLNRIVSGEKDINSLKPAKSVTVIHSLSPGGACRGFRFLKDDNTPMLFDSGTTDKELIEAITPLYPKHTVDMLICQVINTDVPFAETEGDIDISNAPK